MELLSIKGSMGFSRVIHGLFGALLICNYSVSIAAGSATDLTRVPESAGEDVAIATLAIIQEACIFQNDFMFLRRLAFVLTNNGMAPKTYGRPDFHGGIWQVRSRETH